MAAKADPIREGVAEDEGAGRHGTRNAGLAQPCVVAGIGGPTLGEAPDAVQDPRRNDKGDREDEKAVRGVVELVRRGFPSGKSQAKDATKAAESESSRGIAEGMGNPEIREGGAAEEEKDREDKRADIEVRKPTPGEATRSPGAIPLNQSDGHKRNADKNGEEHKGWHDEQRHRVRYRGREIGTISPAPLCALRVLRGGPQPYGKNLDSLINFK